tara:strand:+ start:155 stop:340 length:186 start_codon:yes stop_codon:yes gene_type:complete
LNREKYKSPSTAVKKIKIAISVENGRLLSKNRWISMDIEITLKMNPNMNPSKVFFGLIDVK